MGDIIEKVKGVDFGALEIKMEEEGNKIAKKKYPKIFSWYKSVHFESVGKVDILRYFNQTW